MGGIDMKAVDLMIGDWVKIKGHLDYDKVQEIARDENMQWYISFACSATLFRAYEFEPVPLTPEILEKNGWEHDGIFMNKRIDENTCFSWTDRYGAALYKNTYHMCDCNYVHTLQHALRLCGLDELADNFKL